jgi:hypothetical protein
MRQISDIDWLACSHQQSVLKFTQFHMELVTIVHQQRRGLWPIHTTQRSSSSGGIKQCINERDALTQECQ